METEFVHNRYPVMGISAPADNSNFTGELRLLGHPKSMAAVIALAITTAIDLGVVWKSGATAGGLVNGTSQGRSMVVHKPSFQTLLARPIDQQPPEPEELEAQVAADGVEVANAVGVKRHRVDPRLEIRIVAACAPNMKDGQQ